MNPNISKYINYEDDCKEIEFGAKKIRNKYASNPSSTQEYLQDLFAYFIDDIKKVAEKIYEKILFQKDSLKIKINPTNIRESIYYGTNIFLSTYDRIISLYMEKNQTQKSLIMNIQLDNMLKHLHKQIRIIILRYVLVTTKMQLQYIKMA